MGHSGYCSDHHDSGVSQRATWRVIKVLMYYSQQSWELVYMDINHISPSLATVRSILVLKACIFSTWLDSFPFVSCLLSVFLFSISLSLPPSCWADAGAARRSGLSSFENLMPLEEPSWVDWEREEVEKKILMTAIYSTSVGQPTPCAWLMGRASYTYTRLPYISLMQLQYESLHL